MTKFQIAVATDMTMFEPTLVTVMSALEGASAPVTVHFLGMDLGDAERVRLDAAIGLHPGTELVLHDMSRIVREEGWESLAFDGGHSPMTNAILFVPILIGEGRVLFLDSDTLVHGDIAPLFAIDMAGCHIGAVRDYYVIQKMLEILPGVETKLERALGQHAMQMAPRPLSDFINTGVVLFDVDSIMSVPGLAAAIVDPSDLFTETMRLVSLLKDRTLHIDPAWNAFCGMYARFGMLHNALVEDGSDYVHRPPRISHYLGVAKPWHDINVDDLTRDFVAVRSRVFQALESAGAGVLESSVFLHLTDRASHAEFASGYRLYRRSRARLLAMLDGQGRRPDPR